MSTITIPSHCMITVRRPTGDIETLNYTDATGGQVRELNDCSLAQLNDLMDKAGRGQVIGYENHTKEVAAPVPSAEDLAEAEYIRERNAILRASAGGESMDTDQDDWDNTPSHKQD